MRKSGTLLKLALTCLAYIWLSACGGSGSGGGDDDEDDSTTIAAFERVLYLSMTGSVPQTDTLDPKPASMNAYPPTDLATVSTGALDIYGNGILVTEALTNLATRSQSNPNIGLGIIRSLNHPSRSHSTAQEYMAKFRTDADIARWPGAAVWFEEFFSDSPLPAVMITGSNFNDLVDPAASGIAVPLQIIAGQIPVPNPLGTDTPFDLTGVTLVPGATNAVRERLTVARNLLIAGARFVTVGIGGNDSHSNNLDRVRTNWGAEIDQGLVALIDAVEADGQPTLILISGEFGRTPETVASGRDGRDHWSINFSVAVIAVNRPEFIPTAIGDTGPDGIWTNRATGPMASTLIDPIRPEDLGTFLIAAMGIDPFGSESELLGPTGNLQNLFPASGNRGIWLLEQFGLGAFTP